MNTPEQVLDLTDKPPEVNFKTPTEEETEAIKAKLKKMYEEEARELKRFEPYELSEIVKIVNKVRKTIRNVKNRDIKIRHLSVVLDEINLRIDNSLSAYHYLEQKQAIDDPEFFWNEVEQAENFRKQIEIEIKELQLAELEASYISQELQLNTVSTSEEASIPESKPARENMNIEQVADYIGVSKSTLNHLADEEKIPFIEVGRRNIYRKEDVDKWMADRANVAKLSDGNETGNNIQEKSKTERKYCFKFLIPLKPLVKAFREKGYLNDENEKLFADRFQEGYLEDNISQKIEWEDEIKSLITFVMVSDLLSWIKMPSKDRIEINGERHVPLSPFLNNFNRDKRSWRGKRIVSDSRNLADKALDELCKKTAKYLKKSTSLSFKELLVLFFDYQDSVTIYKVVEEGIDIQMLKILLEHYKKLKTMKTIETQRNY